MLYQAPSFRYGKTEISRPGTSFSCVILSAFLNSNTIIRQASYKHSILNMILHSCIAITNAGQTLLHWLGKPGALERLVCVILVVVVVLMVAHMAYDGAICAMNR